jgi:murein DD-endopeptidase MepM/ murein hydrolase activator NlpD
MKTRVSVLLVLLVLMPAGQAAAGSYLPPEHHEGATFPVARSRWYSVINFSNDWHAPRMRLIDGKWRQVGVHEGTDVFAEPGTPVRAILPGVVEQAGWTFYSGWRIGIRDAAGRYWFYAHLARPPSLPIGRRVDTGDRLGFVGNTGYGNTPGHKNEFTYHLHLGIQGPDGVWVNPYPMLKRLYREATR